MKIYKSYEDAANALPDCRVVLTTAPNWDADPKCIGSFQPAYRTPDGRYTNDEGAGFFMDDDIGWIIAERPIDNTIFTIDKPFKELTKELRSELIEHWVSGGKLEYFHNFVWNDADHDNIINRCSTYRAKRKSERDEFIEKCREITGKSVGERYGKLFDNGCRFTKGTEDHE
jgi:hypothetical protein